MTSFTPAFLINFFVSFSLTNGNEINQLYMSVQRDVSFEPIINDYMVEKFTFINKLECPAMCLSVLDCQLVMYNSIDSSCTIYNSTNEVFNLLDGHIVYMVSDTITITSATTNPTTEVHTSSAGIGQF